MDTTVGDVSPREGLDMGRFSMASNIIGAEDGKSCSDEPK
jgi:hypothetical protein